MGRDRVLRLGAATHSGANCFWIQPTTVPATIWQLAGR